MIKIGKHLAKTCDVCFKTMRGDNLERHMLKHEKGRKDDMKREEVKDDEVINEGTMKKQTYEMIKRHVQLDTAENIEKINLG